jgi:uncharacterized LabA/DUF88 family protein
VTTQNTHQEQYDVDANVVEYPSTPESTNAPETSDANLPAEAEAQASENPIESENSEKPEEQVPSPEAEPANSAKVEEERQDTAPAVVVQKEEEGQEKTADSDQQEAQNIEESERVVSVDQPAPVAAEQETVEEAPTYTYTAEIPLTEVEAEIRPFTDFIEEFRQAEARLQASVQEAEVFHAIAPADVTASEQETLPEVNLLEEVGIPESVIKSIDEARIETATAFPQESPALAIPETDVESDMSKEKENTLVAEVADISENSGISEVPTAQEEQTVKAAQEETTASKPAERAVSPLLRPPTSRLRLPRHGTTRHQQREAVAEVQPEAEKFPVNKVEEPATLLAPAEVEISAVQTEAEVAAVVEEKPAEVEKPRPARRYRFDRPASTNNNKPVVPPSIAPVRSEEHPVASAPATRSEEVASPSDINSEATAKPIANGVHQVEQNEKAPAAEVPVIENVNGTANGGQEHNRRRQSHERNKEQTPASTAPAPAPEASAQPTETPAKTKEVVPEDLPPLEYADLQKVNSRRRRRHRSGSSNGVPAAPAPVIQNAAAAAPTPPPAAPARPADTNAIVPDTTPTTAPTPASQYTIVSGYTVNQMNMGNEASGPFMAPEPSPARGSIITRDGRVPSRSEVQRGPAPTYPHVRPASEAGLTSAALNHFGNTISQAIQMQTDRMVAELHRATQTPANISVTLPPFPSNERVGVFVDVANLLYSARTLNLAVDFGKLLDFLRGNRRLIRAQAYCPTSPQPGAEQMFLQAVKGLGYRITTKHYKTFSSGAKKADLDLDLCMDIVRLVDGRAVDCIVLVSGDSDFMPLLDYCSDHGVRVEVAAFDEAMSATLRQSCDLFVNLSMLDEVLVRA